MPLQIEMLYNEYNFVGSFAVASLLTLLALVTLAVKAVVEWKSREMTGAPDFSISAQETPPAASASGAWPVFTLLHGDRP
jgi:sulfate transport system permease protein